MHTLLTYLNLYKEFSHEDQMKRVVSLLHRIAVKAASPQLFFKVCSLIHGRDTFSTDLKM